MQLDGLSGVVAAMTTTSTIGKIACAYMPVFIFFAQGFEHSVVNMFIIPTGMMMGAKVTVARVVDLESDSGDARQSRRRLRLYGPGALSHAQVPPHRACAAHRSDRGSCRMSEADLKGAAGTQSGDFEPEQKRYLEGFVAGIQIAKAAKSVAGAAAPGAARCRSRARRARCRGAEGAESRRRVRRQAVRSGEVQARTASLRRL